MSRRDPYDIPDGEGVRHLACGCGPYSIWGATDPASFDPSCPIHGVCTCGPVFDPRCPQHGGDEVFA